MSKPILKLETPNGSFRGASLTVIATGEEIPAGELEIRMCEGTSWVELKIPLQFVVVDLDPAKDDRERAEYERLKKRFGGGAP